MMFHDERDSSEADRPQVRTPITRTDGDDQTAGHTIRFGNHIGSEREREREREILQRIWYAGVMPTSVRKDLRELKEHTFLVV